VGVIARARVDQQTQTEANATEEPEVAARKSLSKKREPLPVG
jgi:hypothetical protein